MSSDGAFGKLHYHSSRASVFILFSDYAQDGFFAVGGVVLCDIICKASKKQLQEHLEFNTKRFVLRAMPELCVVNNIWRGL